MTQSGSVNSTLKAQRSKLGFTQSSILNPQSFLPDSPIARAELRYQRHAAGKLRRWQRIFLRLGYGFLVTLSAILYFGQLAGSLLRRDSNPIFAALAPYVVILMVVTLATHVWLLLRTMMTACNSIAHEKMSGTWDVLILTGIDARQIVFGKWWATMRFTAREFWLLLPLRVAMSVYIGHQISYVSYSYMMFSRNHLIPVPPNLINLVLIVPLLALFTFAGAGLAAAVGVLASAAFRRATAAVGAALGVYITLLIVGVGAVSLLVAGLDAQFPFREPERYERYLVTRQTLDTIRYSWIENGTLLNASLVTFGWTPAGDRDAVAAIDLRSLSDNHQRTLVSLAIGLVICLGLYPLVIRAVLKAAERAAALRE